MMEQRTRALLALGLSVAIAGAAWFALYRAADAGVSRLARIDRVRATCDSGWANARTDRDTAIVDGRALADTIDAGSEAQLAQCGDLRPSDGPKPMPNPREMNPGIPRRPQ